MGEQFELTPAFVHADETSIKSQRRFVRSTRLQLILLVLASGLSAFSWLNGRFDITALLAGVAFLVAAGLRFNLLRRQPHTRWYEGRAAAESLKTLGWRYAVAGHPFPISLGPAADPEFVAQSKGVVELLNTLNGALTSDRLFEPTANMKLMRGSSLDERKEAYLSGRIEDQFDWYTGKAKWNERRARFWSAMVLILQSCGAVGAFLRGFGIVRFDLFGVAAAIAAAAAAWLGAKQHAEVASAYSVAADELKAVQHLLPQVGKEEEWARFVSDAEEAVSREHTMWKSTSNQRRPVNLP